MKSRESAARFIERQLLEWANRYDASIKGGRHHYGLQELRELMDFIYERSPSSIEELHVEYLTKDKK